MKVTLTVFFSGDFISNWKEQPQTGECAYPEMDQLNAPKTSDAVGSGDSIGMDNCTDTNENSISVVAHKGKAIVLFLYLFLYSYELNNFLEKLKQFDN